MNVVCIIQARLGSTRLPGKVLADINGRTMLAHVIERARAVPGVGRVAVATTTAQEDDAVTTAARLAGAEAYRGHPSDVLDRYYQAALAFKADAVVRITADCPLLDAAVSGLVARRFLEGDLDYCSNIMPPSFPDGLDTEIVSFGALERVWRTARLESDREHVTTYIRTHPAEFRLANVESATDLSGLRWTVDEPADLDFVRGVLRLLDGGAGAATGMTDVLRVVRDHPELAELNASFQRNEGWLKSVRDDQFKGAKR